MRNPQVVALHVASSFLQRFKFFQASALSVLKPVAAAFYQDLDMKGIPSTNRVELARASIKAARILLERWGKSLDHFHAASQSWFGLPTEVRWSKPHCWLTCRMCFRINSVGSSCALRLLGLLFLPAAGSRTCSLLPTSVSDQAPTAGSGGVCADDRRARAPTRRARGCSTAPAGHGGPVPQLLPGRFLHGGVVPCFKSSPWSITCKAHYSASHTSA